MYRIGQGIDFHKLVEGREFWLGGILIPHSKGALGYSDADALVHAKVAAGNVATPPLDKLVGEKLAAGRVKDYAGLVKAHAVADAQGHPVLAAPYWKPIVGEAMRRLKRGQSDSGVHRYPDWLGEMVKSDFDHPAYHKIPRK